MLHIPTRDRLSDSDIVILWFNDVGVWAVGLFYLGPLDTTVRRPASKLFDLVLFLIVV